MVEVAALTLDLLVLAGQQLHGFTAALAALLSPGHPALGLLQLALSLAVVAGILDDLALGR